MNGKLTYQEYEKNLLLARSSFNSFIHSDLITLNINDDACVNNFIKAEYKYTGEFLSSVNNLFCKIFTIENIRDCSYEGRPYKMLILKCGYNNCYKSVSLRTFEVPMVPYFGNYGLGEPVANISATSTIDGVSGKSAYSKLSCMIGQPVLLRYAFMCQNDFGRDQLCLRLSELVNSKTDILLSRAYVLHRVLHHPEGCINVIPDDCWGVGESGDVISRQVRDEFAISLETLLVQTITKLYEIGVQPMDLF